MKKILTAILTPVILTTISAHVVRADIGIVESTANVLVGTNNVYVSTVGTSNPRWGGYNFGTFDLNASAILNLNNFYFENFAYNGGSVPPGGLYNDNWLDGSSIATFKLFRDSALLSTTSMRQSIPGQTGSNRNWDLGAAGVSIDILNGLSGTGTYNLSWTIDWTYNQWSGSAVVVGTTQSTSGGNATFSTIPEPSTPFLMGLGLAGLLALRRIRSNLI